jgi:hypothetical protein
MVRRRLVLQGEALLRAAFGVEGRVDVVELLPLLHLDGDAARVVDVGLVVVDDGRRDRRLVAGFRVPF